MTKAEKIQNEVIQRFGDAYKSFGLNKLMGHIVALLISSEEPVSLDEIAKKLGRSKGPVSQIVRRLKDKHLIRKVWFPENNRKDYYEVEPEIFENAFRNNLELIKNNRRIADYMLDIVEKSKQENLVMLRKRMKEMETFYSVMEKNYKVFLDEWAVERKKLNQ